MRKVHRLFAGVFAVTALMALSPGVIAASADAAHQRTATTRDESTPTGGLNQQGLRAAEAGKAPHLNASRAKSHSTVQKGRSAKSRVIARAKAIRKGRKARVKRQKQV